MAFVVRAQSADSRPYGHTVTRFDWHAYWNSISEITDSNCSVWHNIARSSTANRLVSVKRELSARLASWLRQGGCIMFPIMLVLVTGRTRII